MAEEQIIEQEAQETKPPRLAVIVRGFVVKIAYSQDGYEDEVFSFVESETAEVGQRWTGDKFVDRVIRRQAQVRDGVVVNVCDAAEGFDAGDGSEFVPSDEAQTGQLYEGGKFSDAPPSPPVLHDLTMRQFRLGLLQAGLLDAVDKAITALPGDAGKAARIEFEYASVVVRSDPLIASLAGQLGLSDEQVDALWLSALEL